MTTTYIVFDLGHLKDPFQYRLWKEAVRDFYERKLDGDAVRLVTWTPDLVEDETGAAEEAAAKIFLKDADEFSDIPGWVNNTDACDDWREQLAISNYEARREYDHQRALRANL